MNSGSMRERESEAIVLLLLLTTYAPFIYSMLIVSSDTTTTTANFIEYREPSYSLIDDVAASVHDVSHTGSDG